MLLVRGNTGGSLNTAFLRVSPNVGNDECAIYVTPVTYL